MRRLAFIVPLLIPTAPAAADPPVVVCPERTSWLAGSVELCAGTLTYHDYVYDDYGADTGGFPSKSWGSLSPQAGDVRYPDDAENSADLLGLDLRIGDGAVHVTFRLNSLYSSGQSIGAISIDTDDDADTGGGAWPGVNIASSGWDVVHTFDEGDPHANTIEGSFPQPSGDTWRVQAVTAQADGTVMNVAFRGTDESGGWWENAQAAALRSGDISAFGHTVAVADLIGGVTRPAAAATPGLHQRVYRSDVTIGPGEGYTYTPIPGRAGDAPLFPQTYEFLGHHQPYGIYIPSTPAPHGVQFVLHGASANHASLIGADGVQQRLGEELDRVILVPLGRGRVGFYSDYSELDVLDVLADVQATYDIDADRIFLGGYSMGGYGTLRLATLYPDRFAGYANWVGFTGDDGNGTMGLHTYPAGAIGNPVEYAGNLRYVPGANLYTGLDELVHVWTSSLGLQPALRDAGVPYVFYQHPVAEHFTLALTDDWRKEADYTRDLTLVRDPARVTYRAQKLTWNEELGLRHDRAYWVRDIVPSGDGFADTDLTTHGCGGTLPVVSEQLPGIGLDPVPWISNEGAVTGETPLVPGRKLVGTLSGVASLTVDVDAACLAGGPVAYAIAPDGPVTLTLSDGRTLTLDAGANAGTVA